MSVCVRCGETAPEMARACEHVARGPLVTYALIDASAPTAACTACETTEPSTLALCPRCFAAALARNISVTDTGRARGFELATRASYLAALELDRPVVPAAVPGAYVKLGFSSVPAALPRYLESMWVRVRRRDGNTVRGVLANDPELFPPEVLHDGTLIGFRSEHVVDARFDTELYEISPAHVCEMCSEVARAERTDLDDSDRKLLGDVATYGWHNVGIAEEDGDPGYTFTVGLQHTFDHPDLVLFGLEPDIRHNLLNHIGALVRDGNLFEPNVDYDGILEGLPVRFRAVATRHHYEFLGFACWFYGGEYPALQLFWPDAAGAFPWDTGYDKALAERQPRLDR